MKYPEAAPFVTKVGFGAQYAAALIINKAVYDGLPAELQTILREAAQAWAAAAAEAQQSIYDNAYGSVAQNFPGATTFELPREEQVKWAEAMPNIAKEWAERIDAQGLPGSAVLSAYMNELRSAGADPVRNWDQN
jgi:TRAP-type C4-dicarboxylate transport system substrate-binding protein